MQQIVGIPSGCVFFSILVPDHSKDLFTNSSRTVWELWNFKNTIFNLNSKSTMWFNEQEQ